MNLETALQYTESDDLSKKLSAGILAGGKSRRMGKNKALLRIGNETFLKRLTVELSCFNELLISVDDSLKYQEYAGLTERLLMDTNRDIGPIEGIYQILLHAKTDYVFVCGVDIPLIKKELVLYMAGYISSDYDCYVIREQGRAHPLCAIYSKSILPVVKKLIEGREYAVKNIFQRSRVKYIDIEDSCFSKKLLCNINTVEEYRKCFSPIIFCVSGLKNSGKTTLIEKLLKCLSRENLRVHVLKHDGHDFLIDREGTDTCRYMKAGADSVGIFSIYKNALIEKRKDTTVTEMIEKMTACDVLIIEGMKDSIYPKIEVIREEICDYSVCNPETLICIASDMVKIKNSEADVVSINDIEAVYRHIKFYYDLQK